MVSEINDFSFRLKIKDSEEISEINEKQKLRIDFSGKKGTNRSAPSRKEIRDEWEKQTGQKFESGRGELVKFLGRGGKFYYLIVEVDLKRDLFGDKLESCSIRAPSNSSYSIYRESKELDYEVKPLTWNKTGIFFLGAILFTCLAVVGFFLLLKRKKRTVISWDKIILFLFIFVLVSVLLLFLIEKFS